MTERERMLAGKLYYGLDEELVVGRREGRALTDRINATSEAQIEERMALFRELFGSVGETFWIEPPFRVDYGKNITVGNNFYANFDCIILDVAPVTIGDNVFFAPRVSLFTAKHPIDAGVRNSGLELASPIRIGSNVWIGGHTIINPGVTIGDNVVIGSGSVVTRDIPSNCVAAGVPCRVLRPITAEDKAYWEAEAAQYYAEMGQH